MMTLQSTSFWNFSNQLYDRNGIANICLQIQTEFDLDVNLLLFCYWLANFDYVVTESEWHQILEFSKDWKRNIVQPLRNSRNSLKAELINHDLMAQCTALRERIKIEELAAEKIQQEFIQASTRLTDEKSQPFSNEQALNNVSYLFSKLGTEANERLFKKLEKISSAVSSPQLT